MTLLTRLARNTALSAAAFGVNGLIGLALVPIVAGAYGLAQFGLLTLARTLLPTGALAVLDLGVAEIATQAVGRARGSGNWARAGEDLGVLLALSAGAGAALAIALALLAPALAALFGAGPAERESFAGVLWLTALALAAFFPGLVAEGVVKGFERFGTLRAIEVLATIAYACATLVAVAAGWSYAAVGYAYLAAMLARYAALAGIAASEMRRVGLRPRRWSRASREDVLRRSGLMFQSKVLGTLQMPVPPLAIGALLGPGAVGLYEIITRLPRFLKSTLSLLASAVLPVAARLEGRGAGEQLGGLALKSFWLVPYVTFPVLFAVAGFARPVLELWVGPQLAAQWPWMALMLAYPLLQVCLYVSQAALQVRPEYMARANRISAVGIAIQYAVSMAFIGPFGAMSFVLGIALATAATFPFHVHLVARSLSLSGASLWRPMLSHGALAALLGAMLAVLDGAAPGLGAALVAALFAAGLAACWGAAYALLLERGARELIGRLASSLLHGAQA
jgi:O-antigen/teichoic acid export membrane protein